MKPITYFLLIAVMIVSSCKKDVLKSTTTSAKTNISITAKDTTKGTIAVKSNSPVDQVLPDSVSKAALLGKWKIVGNMVSAGGPMYFVPASGNDFVVFNADGSIAGSAFPDFTYYMLKDNLTIHITKSDKITYTDYRSGIKNDTLTMGLAGPTYCVEGCAVKLVKE